MGNVLSGGWEPNGEMHLFLYFQRSVDEPLDDPSSPSNFLAKYKLDGDLRVEDSAGSPQGAIYKGIWRLVERESNTSAIEPPEATVGLNAFGGFTYHCFRTPSGMSIAFQNAIKLPRLSSDQGDAQFSYVLSNLLVAAPTIKPRINYLRALGRFLA